MPFVRSIALLMLVVLLVTGCTLFSIGPYFLDIRYDPTGTPTPPPSPAPAISATPALTPPYVTANVAVNVRSGDSTEYPILSTLQAGESAPLLGISSTGTGWFYVQPLAEDALPGFVSFEFVTVTGDVSALPNVEPPRPPLKPTNLTVTYTFGTPDGRAVCDGETPIVLRVANTGEDLALTVVAHVAMLAQDGRLLTEQFTRIPPIEAGNTFEKTVMLAMHLRPDGVYQMLAEIDINGEFPETDENDNSSSASFALECGRVPNLYVSGLAITAVNCDGDSTVMFSVLNDSAVIAPGSDAQVDVAETDLFGMTPISALERNGAAPGSVNLPLHTLAPGEYVLRARADASMVVTESNESDNATAIAFTVSCEQQ